MSSLLQNTIFGNTKNKPNTFIGGVAGTINTPALIAARLGLSVSRIKSFATIGNDIQFLVTGGVYSLPNGAFSGVPLTYFNDSLGLITSLNTSFQNCKSLTNVNFPNLTAINGNFTFSGCSSITTYNSPKLTTINGTSVFSGCSLITSYNFPDLKTITGNSIFTDNTSLTAFTAPNLILSVSNERVFYGSNNLAVLNIGKPTGIGILSFYNTKITAIDLSNCNQIAVDAFNQCTSLKNIVDMNVVTTIEAYAFNNCYSLLNFSAVSLINIGLQTFFNCKSLTSIDFPNLTTINGSSAFSGCSSVTTYEFQNLTTITGGSTFTDNTSLTAFNAPNLILSISNTRVFYGSNNLAVLNIGKPTGVGGASFYNTKIIAIDLSNCTQIAVDAFNQCTSLKNIVNMNAVTTIEAYAFNNCYSLLNFSAGWLLSINLQTFMNCKSLTSIDFPNLTTINGASAFSGCSSIASYDFQNLTTITGGSTFTDNTSLTAFNAPNLILSISNIRVFYGSNNLAILNIGKSTGVAAASFYNTKITAIDLSNCIQIADDAFNRCTLLNNVNSLSNTTLIGNYAFFGCSSLTTNITSAVTTLGISVFQGCALVPSYNFPNLTIIGSNIFNGNSSVSSIYIPLLTQCGSTAGINDVFFNIKTGCTITVATLLSTANSGAPDGDLVYAKNSRGANIVYV